MDAPHLRLVHQPPAWRPVRELDARSDGGSLIKLLWEADRDEPYLLIIKDGVISERTVRRDAALEDFRHAHTRPARLKDAA